MTKTIPIELLTVENLFLVGDNLADPKQSTVGYDVSDPRRVLRRTSGGLTAGKLTPEAQVLRDCVLELVPNIKIGSCVHNTIGVEFPAPHSKSFKLEKQLVRSASEGYRNGPMMLIWEVAKLLAILDNWLPDVPE